MIDPQNVPIATIGKGRGSEVRIALTTFAGQQLIDVRTYLATDESGELRPSKKGVSLRFERLGDLREALAAADERAREMGWTGGGQ